MYTAPRRSAEEWKKSRGRGRGGSTGTAEELVLNDLVLPDREPSASRTVKSEATGASIARRPPALGRCSSARTE